MKIYLLRHGDAGNYGVTGKDFDRKLSEKGKVEIENVRKFFAENVQEKIIVYCSGAKRTRETWEIVSPAISADKIEFLDDLYHASAEIITETIRKTSENFQTILLVGHNFGISEFASQLLDTNLLMKTGSLVQIEFPIIDKWKYVGQGTGVGGMAL